MNHETSNLFADLSELRHSYTSCEITVYASPTSEMMQAFYDFREFQAYIITNRSTQPSFLAGDSNNPMLNR